MVYLIWFLFINQNCCIIICKKNLIPIIFMMCIPILKWHQIVFLQKLCKRWSLGFVNVCACVGVCLFVITSTRHYMSLTKAILLKKQVNKHCVHHYQTPWALMVKNVKRMLNLLWFYLTGLSHPRVGKYGTHSEALGAMYSLKGVESRDHITATTPS